MNSVMILPSLQLSNGISTEATASRADMLTNTVDKQNTTKYSFEPDTIQSLLPFADDIRDLFLSPSLGTGRACCASATRQETNLIEDNGQCSLIYNSNATIERNVGKEA